MADYSNPDYLSLVRKEYAKDGEKNAEHVSFCKVKKTITNENFKSEFKQNFIFDDDLPESFANVKWIPLSMTEFPKVLSSMTANQAGYWALRKCREQRWPLSDYDCCLANLEMDM